MLQILYNCYLIDNSLSVHLSSGDNELAIPLEASAHQVFLSACPLGPYITG